MDYKRAILNFSFVVSGTVAGMSRPGQVNTLAEDLFFLKDEGIGAILSLSETALEEEPVRKSGFAYLHVPVDDFRAPTIKQVEHCMDFMEQAALVENKAIVVHCGAGCGRTGTILACFLVKSGKTAEEAIESIKAMRPCSIETDGQKAMVYQYEEHLKYQSPDTET